MWHLPLSSCTWPLGRFDCRQHAIYDVKCSVTISGLELMQLCDVGIFGPMKAHIVGIFPDNRLRNESEETWKFLGGCR
jgi:hypothetical protein